MKSASRRMAGAGSGIMKNKGYAKGGNVKKTQPKKSSGGSQNKLRLRETIYQRNDQGELAERERTYKRFAQGCIVRGAGAAQRGKKFSRGG